MFGTSSRGRQHQRASPPPPGVDSCYGVRSLNGSVSWSGESDEPERDLPPANTNDGDEQIDPQDGSEDHDETPEPVLAPSPTIVPPSPDDSLHPLHRLMDDYPLHDPPSEPSSPASFTSMPSYVASVSSVSRTSSPIGSARDFGRHLGAGSEDLVLPMLSLPSTSLHMSLRRWEGEVGGVKVVLAGSAAALQKAMRGLGERCELAEMGTKGEVGVVRAGRVVALLITGLSAEQSRVMGSYKALDGLLHPSPPTGAREQLAGLVGGYAAKHDWAHLVFSLDADDGLINTLAPIVPTMATNNHVDGLFTLPEEDLEASRVRTPSPPQDADPTPMPSAETLNYFEREPTPSPPMDVDPIDLLIRAIDSAELIQEASITKFISWRPARSLESSMTSSVSPASSSSDISRPMPTVARAQRAGEWEAGLSRRVAQRKEVHHVHRGRVRRRVSRSPERPPCHPLFPKASPKTASVGLNALAESFFRPLRMMWDGQRVWNRAVLACAVAVAVGVGYWARAR